MSSLSEAFRKNMNADSFRRAEEFAANSDVKKQILQSHKMSEEEYKVFEGFLGRIPTLTELGVTSSMWSEHCSYKSSRVHLGRFPTEGEQVVVGPGENAGVVRLEGDLCLAFKMESHNHPSYIEPYQGAATGVGGILRDVFCMGARPIANLNALRFGRKDHPKTTYLLENAVKGIGHYGNCVGVPTVGGSLAFHKSYDGNCLVNAMTVGLIREKEIFKGYASGVGNLLIYLGSATGRDGVQGATMASDSFSSADEGQRSAIQVGDPFMEKLLIEATLEALKTGLIIGLQDMGAAGLTSSSFEMASRAGLGLFMNLDLVPTRETSLSAYDLMLSESQERMLLVCKPSSWDQLKEIFDRWALSSAIIGEVTDTGRVEAIYKGTLEVDIPVDPLTEAAPKYRRPMSAPLKQKERAFNKSQYEPSLNASEIFRQILAAKPLPFEIFEQYDRHVGTKTYSDSEAGGAALLHLKNEVAHLPYLGISIACGSDDLFGAENAEWCGAYSVLKCVRALFACGTEPMAVTDCLNFGSPEKPQIMRQFSDAVDGISIACKTLSIPVVSGNVSLYNETDGESIFPTPMIGVVGKIKDLRKSFKPTQVQASHVYLLSSVDSSEPFLGSFDTDFFDLPAIKSSESLLPAWEAEIRLGEYIQNLAVSGEYQGLACRDLGFGGVLNGVLKMILPSQLAFSSKEGLNWSALEWSGRRHAAYIVSVPSEMNAAFVKASHNAMIQKNELGTLDFGKKAHSFSGLEISQLESKELLRGYTLVKR